LQELANECAELIEDDPAADDKPAVALKPVYLSDPGHFRFVTAKTGWAKAAWPKLSTGNERDIPLYSAARTPVAFVGKKEFGQIAIKASDDEPLISFGANGDGSAGTNFNFVYHTRPFLAGLPHYEGRDSLKNL
jgi:hypothetical protein